MTSYKTLAAPGRAEFIINKSVFIGAAMPAQTEEEALAFLLSERGRYKDASHHCYAYVVGQNAGIQRYSDAGEPGGTAGQPILSVLNRQGIVNAAVVVTRYFGGVLLGAAGLIRAYTQGAAEAVKAAGAVEMIPSVRLLCAVPYARYEKLANMLDYAPCVIEERAFEGDVTLTLLVREVDMGELKTLLDNALGGADVIELERAHCAWAAGE